METKFQFDAFDYDGTHTFCQKLKHKGIDIGKIINEKLSQFGNLEHVFSTPGSEITIKIGIKSPAMGKQETVEYNRELVVHFEVLEKEKIAVTVTEKGIPKKDKLTKAERSYLKEITDGLKNKAIAIIHNNSVETVRTHRRNNYRKTNCHTPEQLKIYCIKHRFPGF